MKPISCPRTLDCFGAARLAMTSYGRHCEPKAKQSRPLRALHPDLMRERDLAAFARGGLDRKRDFERGLAPASVMNRLAVGADRGPEVVEHVAASDPARPLRNRHLAPAGFAVDRHAVGGGAQLAARTGRDGHAEMGL